jgi:hypothetical protein
MCAELHPSRRATTGELEAKCALNSIHRRSRRAMSGELEAERALNSIHRAHRKATNCC